MLVSFLFTYIGLRLGNKINDRLGKYATLFGGIITDSGRFQYGETSSRTLRVSANLLDLGADKEYIYSNIYIRSII